jgi:Protein of unknown function (DUF433)
MTRARRMHWSSNRRMLECYWVKTMSTITAYPHIVKEPGAPARLESHPRTRVAMIVMDYLGRGLGPEDIVRHYPYLKLAEVHAAMTYYHDHRAEIDAEIQDELDQLQDTADANSGSAIWQKLKASGVI